jgi:ferric-dicitrate binding protein FerR (iron transport regulator)
MPVQLSHDRLYPAAPRADELPEGVPDQAGPTSPQDRGEAGRFARGNTLARRGGKALAGKTRLSTRLGLRSLPDDAAFRPYKAAAKSFQRSQCAALAASVGAGYCGPAPSSMVASAALQLAWSRYLSDQAAATGDPAFAMAASKLADASRNNLLSAHEACAREAAARPRAPVDYASRFSLPIPTPKDKS